MELEDLKHTWQNIQENKESNINIMEIIQNKSYGPVAALKKVFKKQMILMAIIPFVLLLTSLDNLHIILTSIMFWAYVCFCIGIILFARYNYVIASKMEIMDGDLFTTLEDHLKLLAKRMKWELTLMRCVLIFFIALTEIIPYFQHYRVLDLWHSFSPVIRIGFYASLVIAQYFINQNLSRQKVGRHLEYLKNLITELRN